MIAKCPTCGNQLWEGNCSWECPTCKVRCCVDGLEAVTCSAEDCIELCHDCMTPCDACDRHFCEFHARRNEADGRRYCEACLTSLND